MEIFKTGQKSTDFPETLQGNTIYEKKKQNFRSDLVKMDSGKKEGPKKLIWREKKRGREKTFISSGHFSVALYKFLHLCTDGNLKKDHILSKNLDFFHDLIAEKIVVCQ